MTYSSLGYLEAPYLEDAYLAEIYANNLGWQINRLLGATLGWQVNLVIYNTKNLRILCDFDSRGGGGVTGNNAWSNPSATGQNWQVFVGGTATGDYDASNLNTDIIEQIYRSTTANNVILRCDTETAQGVSPDTFAILGHNLSKGALVTITGATNSDMTGQIFTTTLDINTENAYYIVPEGDFPLDQARYWQFAFQDPSNSDGYIQIGTILFGRSVIMDRENFNARVRFGHRHFKDEIRTEGFTTVSNDRALKKYLRIDFQNLSFGTGNYTKLANIFDKDRTSLKCLWIPTPVSPPPQRFAVFGKLKDIPEEEHNVIGDANEDLDFISMSIEVDESL